MKKFAIRALLAIAAATVFVEHAAQAQVNVSVTLGGFYDELAPYGRWVGCSYGQCWVPARVGADWQPYSNGQWIYTEYGWTWVSDDPWGGNPYHYGTWTSIAGLGWAWVPGTVWAPAWVTWSYSNSYVGWAPIPPTVVFGASGYAGAPVIVSQTQYVFVTTNNFVGRNVSSVRIPQQQSAQIFRETRPVTGFAVSGGIVRNTALPMATIERASKSKIETRSIQTARTAPRAVSSGTAHFAVVAPASEMKAVAAQPRGGNRSSEASRAPKDAQPPADHAPASAKAHGAPPVQAQHQAPAAHEAKAAPPAKSQTASRSPESSRAENAANPARPPADREPSKAKPAKAHDGPPMESHSQAADAHTVKHQDPPRQAEANAPAEHAKPKPPSSKPKPSEQDKKPDGDRH